CLLPGLLPSTQAAFLQSQLIAPNNLGSSIYLPREDGSDKDHSKGSRDWRVFSSGLEGRAKLRLFGKLCIFCDPVISAEPIVTVTSKAEIIQTETHICRVDGFFPKDINATWRKDGEIWLQDTLYGLVVPNSDGTYHFWINPGERNHFQCHVEHDSLKSPPKVVLMAPGERSETFSCVAGLLVTLGKISVDSRGEIQIFSLLALWVWLGGTQSLKGRRRVCVGEVN
uniref:Ig-like domain-containing protein n=1 Tax=Naja naja TaxID=35670 RepID=A0A8C6VD34_NAJNA